MQSTTLRRIRVALWAASLLALVISLGLLWTSREHAQAAYRGTSLGGTPAPSFTLTNQHGRTVSLEDYRGRVVLLTFLDGHCQDVCPATLRTMADLERRLGAQASDLAIAAISVDPWLDRVGEPAFIAQGGAPAPRQWDFLTGSLDQLQPVWESYHVRVVPEQVGRFGVNGAHDTGFFLLDRAGRQRLYINSTAPLSAIEGRVRELLREAA